MLLKDVQAADRIQRGHIHDRTGERLVVTNCARVAAAYRNGRGDLLLFGVPEYS